MEAQRLELGRRGIELWIARACVRRCADVRASRDSKDVGEADGLKDWALEGDDAGYVDAPTFLEETFYSLQAEVSRWSSRRLLFRLLLRRAARR